MGGTTDSSTALRESIRILTLQNLETVYFSIPPGRSWILYMDTFGFSMLNSRTGLTDGELTDRGVAGPSHPGVARSGGGPHEAPAARRLALDGLVRFGGRGMGASADSHGGLDRKTDR